MEDVVNASLGASEPTIKITKRTDRSIYMFTLEHCLKPFGAQTSKPKKQYPVGSSHISASKKARSRCNVHERNVEDIYVYDLTAKSAVSGKGESEQKKRIYYFGGGSWQMPPSDEHWSTAAELANKIPNTTVSVVSPPLAPLSPAPIAFPHLLRFYKRVMLDAETAGERVIFAGDSSGGNIVLCLTMAALAESENARCPTAVMAICPTADLREDNPEMEKIEKHDPVLTRPSSAEYAKKWRGEWSAEDPRVNPMTADVTLFAKRGVKVHGVVGGYDILSPDGKLFRDKCAAAGVSGEWLEWDKQMHCFPMAWGYGIPESVAGKDWMVDVLRRC